MLAKERPGHIVKRRRGTRCMRGRERRAIRFGNKQVREGQAGWRDGRARKRQISRRFPAGARGDEGLQRGTAEKRQTYRRKGVEGAKGGRESTGRSMTEVVLARDVHQGNRHAQFHQVNAVNRQLSFSGEFNSFIVSISSEFCRIAFTQEGRGGRETHTCFHILA